MARPVDVAADLLVTRSDEIETVTVESLDPDAEDGSDVLATATGVRAIAGRERGGEAQAAGGQMGQTMRDFTLIAADVGFEPKNRDRVTRDEDGTAWILGDVTEGGFGSLYSCKDAMRQR